MYILEILAVYIKGCLENMGINNKASLLVRTFTDK